MKRLPIPWRLNLAIVAAQLAATGTIFWLAARASEWWQVALLSLGFAIVGNSTYAAMHEAEHSVLLPSRFWNDTLGALLGLLLPGSFHLLRQSHLGHHYRNRSDDEAFDFYFDGDGVVWRWLQLYGILTGFFWLTIVLSNLVLLVLPQFLVRRLLGFDRPSAALWNSLNPRYWWLIRCEAVAAVALHATIVWTLSIPLISYGFIYLGFGLSWSAMQYVHHFGTDRDVVHGTRNLWLFRPVDIVWLHHNWHHTHHERPTVPWLYLPELSRGGDTGREFLLWHYLRMWGGPRYTKVHVENRYAGRIIR
jgi:fatty acid desaturase